MHEDDVFDNKLILVFVVLFNDSDVIDSCCEIIGAVCMVVVSVVVGSRTLRATTRVTFCEHCRSMPATCSELIPRTQTWFI